MVARARANEPAKPSVKQAPTQKHKIELEIETTLDRSAAVKRAQLCLIDKQYADFRFIVRGVK